MSPLFENYCKVRERIRAAALRAGRNPEGILLLAVSKTFPVEAIRELYDAGVRAFGENRIAELEAKKAALPEDIDWHFIGRLQANKARRVLHCATMIHSVDSIALLERLERIAAEEKISRKFLLEINVSGEASKAGCTIPAEIGALARCAAGCEKMQWAGLMTMAPADASPAELKMVFGGLRQWRDRLEEEFGRRLGVLSMGMSGDFECALEEGSTLVRIGSAIFGRRE